MPKREDERYLSSGLRYCVICKRYLSVAEWAAHPHNPDFGRRRARGPARRVAIAVGAALALLALVLVIAAVTRQ